MQKGRCRIGGKLRRGHRVSVRAPAISARAWSASSIYRVEGTDGPLCRDGVLFGANESETAEVEAALRQAALAKA